ncbi:MAG: nucleotide exchange factor GrpE [Lentisphaeraceae bacterium]|nr:nucleotide exchange factor GrpE [Lentisphaeraceae bacterium]
MSKKTDNNEDIEKEVDDNVIDSEQAKESGKDSKKKAKKKEFAKKEKTPEEVIAELKDTVLRTRADFDNFRKRTQRDIADARAYGKISTIEEFLPIFDTFKMAMQAANMDNADLQTLLAGMNMIQNQFNQSFSSLGVDEIDAVGAEFDPTVHEAVSEEHSDDKASGVVLSQHRCGYKMGEKLIRAATVIVSKGPETVEETEAVEEE